MRRLLGQRDDDQRPVGGHGAGKSHPGILGGVSNSSHVTGWVQVSAVVVTESGKFAAQAVPRP
ncbi:hypothetical protein Cco03nite_11460 [Catellatospora coxensis]|uniref:Uncharacterized protein n=1 Tax=Catellatospora coxensis TaxID=310354 RepID=A0A8J3KWM0_9ACTN|nr:hypothetical protein Cco03nite_11460 [Catellatospora coxensis]